MDGGEVMEKPLHVRVAEALGCTETYYDDHPYVPGWRGKPADGHGGSPHVPRYDTDWSATGPLIERYGISVTMDDDDASSVGWLAGTFEYVCGSDGYHAYMDRGYATGETPLIAVCNLILALKEAGKLPIG